MLCIQVRVNGEIEIINDKNLKDEISEHPSRAFLKNWKESGELNDFYNTFVVFNLKNGKAITWTIAQNFEPKKEILL